MDSEKSRWVVTTPSGLQVLLTSLVGVRVHKLDPKKSQWMVTTPSGLYVLTSLVGVRVSKLDAGKSVVPILCKVLMITNTNVRVHMFLLELCCWDRIQKIFDMSCIYNKCLRTVS